MIPDNPVRHIARIYETPGHPNYGPARRLWMMLEQLFADQGGVERFETRLHLYRIKTGTERVRWDEQLHQLIIHGQSECSAQRIVIEQMITAREWLA